MLLSCEQSLLLIIDVQDKLLPVIADGEKTVSRIRWLAEVARELQVPTVVTEQNPQGIGYSSESLSDVLSAARVVEKMHFSAFAEADFRELVNGYQRQQVVISGVEAHVCVLQTAIDLLGDGYQVFVVADAVSSRTSENKAFALQRLTQAGVQIVTTEMVAFEWLEKAGSDIFRHVSKNWIK